jgi:cell division protein FtsW
MLNRSRWRYQFNIKHLIVLLQRQAKELWQELIRGDLWLVLAFAVILALGLLVLSSAASVYSFRIHNDSYYLFKKQFISALIGLIALIIAAKIDYRYWQKNAIYLLGISIVLLAAVFLPEIGVVYKGARSWINLGVTTIQPTEIVKFTLLAYFSAWLVSRRQQIQQFSLKIFMGPLASIILISLLIFIQPDTGTLAVIILMLIGVYFLASAPLRHIFYSIGSIVILFIIGMLVKPYRMSRWLAFINPENDPLGIGYHILQAKLAIGSGGWFGLGIGRSRQKFNYLPEVYGDSIFAIMAEEIGFIFSLLFIGLLLFATWRCYLLAKKAPDDFSRLLAAGICLWFFLQIFFNIGGVLGVMPMTGLTLPFVSYGGTSLVMNLFVVGVLVNISHHIKKSL